MCKTTVKANRQARTFTIRRYLRNGIIAKYRTIPFSKDEFRSMEHNTQSDWEWFLRTGEAYYQV